MTYLVTGSINIFDFFASIWGQISDGDGFSTFVVEDDGSHSLDQIIDENVAVLGQGERRPR